MGFADPIINPVSKNLHSTVKNHANTNSKSFKNGKKSGIGFGIIASGGIGELGEAAELSEISTASRAETLEAGTAGRFGACSFAASTPVLMSDGSTKHIADVVVGDDVLSADQNDVTSQGPEKVDATWIHSDEDLLDLFVVSPETGKKETVHTTANHPIWDDTTKRWTAAGKLQIGHRLGTSSGNSLEVAGLRAVSGSQDMYNLTISNRHTYYVLAGNTPVLVHNSNCGPELSGVDGKQFGSHWGDHSKDYGLNPGDPAARQWYKDRVYEVRGSHDEVRRGEWNPGSGGASDYWFYRKDDDLLVTKGDGTFVTMFPLGTRGNGWWDRATPQQCNC